MADLNRVFLMGRLTFDPELRRTPQQTAVTQLRLATSRSWMGRDNERREETLFIDIEVWDRAAENCCQYLKKGSMIHVEGSLKMNTWEDKNTGEKRSKILVHADRVQFLDRRSDSPGDHDEGYAPAREPARRPASPVSGRPPAGSEVRASRTGQGTSAASPRDDLNEDEDIPF